MSWLKFSEFKVGYHERALEGVDSRHANPPVELPANYDAVSKAINERFGV
jgi:threonine synthase